jgi:cell division protein FtsA
VGSGASLASKLVYGIDVGTTKIVAIAGRVVDGRRGWAEVLSVGEAPSHGLRRGMVVDREAATESVAEAIEACGGALRGGPVSVGIAGGHISSLNTEVTLLNRDSNRMVTERFVRRLEIEARQVELGEDEKVIHVVPRSFVLDGTEGVTQPVGLAARKVTMRAHIVSGAVSSIQNLLGAVEDCGVKVSRVILEPLASSEACLLDEDRSLGVALIDIGGGTTDIAAFMRGALTHTAVIPLGGESFSADVAYGLKLPFDVAEELKLRYGTVLSQTVDDVAAVRLRDKHYNARFISQILEYRAQEVFEYVRDSLDKAGVRSLLPGGAVLTGGGCQLEGMDELAEKILGMPTRTAIPRRIKDDTEPIRKPQYSTAVGLLYFSAKNDDLRPKRKGTNYTGYTSFGSIVTAVKEWFGFGV